MERLGLDCSPSSIFTEHPSLSPSHLRIQQLFLNNLGSACTSHGIPHMAETSSQQADELFNFLIGDHLSWNRPTSSKSPRLNAPEAQTAPADLGSPVPSSYSSPPLWEEEPDSDTLALAILLESGAPRKPKRPRLESTAAKFLPLVPGQGSAGGQSAASKVTRSVRSSGGGGVPEEVPEVTELPQAKGRQQPPHLLAQHPLCNHPALTFNLAPARGGGPAKPGSVLQHCLSMIQSLTSDQLTKFKVGITARPAHRWANYQFGYALEGYLSMQLLHCEQSSRACGFLEAALIAMLRGVSGCQNEAPGGEGFSLDDDKESMCYLYVALQPLPRRPPAGPLRSRDSDPRAPVLPEVPEVPGVTVVPARARATAAKSKGRPPPQ